MRLSLTTTTAAISLAAAGLVLTGCGGGSSTDAPSTSSSASTTVATPASAPTSASAPSTTASAPTPTASSTPSTQAEPAAVKNACKVISVSDMEDIVGADLGSAKNETKAFAGSLCTYSLTNKGRTIVVSGAGGSAGTLSKQAKDLQSSFGKGKLSDTEVTGAEEAKLLTATQSGANVIGVIARKDGYDFAAIVGGAKSAGTYEKDAKKILTVLFKS